MGRKVVCDVGLDYHWRVRSSADFAPDSVLMARRMYSFPSTVALGYQRSRLWPSGSSGSGSRRPSV
jgi:hypothetical protein